MTEISITRKERNKHHVALDVMPHFYAILAKIVNHNLIMRKYQSNPKFIMVDNP